jgi:acetamidase/formamidase
VRLLESAVTEPDDCINSLPLLSFAERQHVLVECNHTTIDYPGVPVDHSKVQEHWGILKNVRIPIRPHFGVMSVAPTEADLVDSIPPNYTGGNIDNWRIGKGATMYYPVAVSGALFSAGDPHASQGDSELCGTAIECSLTGTFQLILHKHATLKGTPLDGLTYPLLETQTEFLVHGLSFPNYLADLGEPRLRSTSSPLSTWRA